MQMTQIQPTNPFETFSQQVTLSKTESQQGNASWFEQNPLRQMLYRNRLEETLSLLPPTTEIVAEMVENMWAICTETAPLVLTQIAPQESYKGKERAILAITIGPLDMVSPQSAVQRSIEQFQQLLAQPLEKNHRLAVVCSLYHNIHSLVVEKSADDTCIIYQSYEQEYTFDAFLQDHSKHIRWTSKKLGQIFAKILSKDLCVKKRIKNYRKIFFKELTEKDFQRYDQCGRFPLLFVSTSAYLQT